MATMTSQYFNARMTQDAMKSMRNKLIREWHPDICKHPDATKIAQQINAEFAYWYTRAASADVKARKEEEQPQKDWSKYTSAKYIDELEEMIRKIYDLDIDRIPGITVELIGVFIWIGGITREMVETREIVKGLGFQGGPKVFDDKTSAYMWKWTPGIHRGPTNHNMDSIRRNYGTEDKRRGANSNGGYKRLKG